MKYVIILTALAMVSGCAVADSLAGARYVADRDLAWAMEKCEGVEDELRCVEFALRALEHRR